MGRFQEYKPISFDIPTFTPDFDALYKLQDQKQKRLDDFNNNTDLLVSSIKAAPIDEADKAKKIQDIYSKKDLVVNELLKNPSQGASVLKRFQSDLKKDVLFGDIYKMNQRNADYEAKMKEIDNAAYGKDPLWKEYAQKQLKNSYGKFYDENGFGKIEGQGFGHNYFNEVQKAALAENMTKVAHDEYQTALQRDPSLEQKGGYEQWYKQEGHKVLSYGKIAGSALPQYMADGALQDYWKTQGEVMGLEGDQSKIKLNPKTGEIDESTLAGKWLSGEIKKRTFDYSTIGYQHVTDQKAVMRDTQAFQMAQQDRAFNQQKAMEGIRHKNALEEILAKQKAEQKAAENKAALTSTSPTGMLIFTRPENPTKVTAAANAEYRKTASNKLADYIRSMNEIIKKGNEYKGGLTQYFIDNPSERIKFQTYYNNAEAAKKQISVLDEKINKDLDNSEFGKLVDKEGTIDNADWRGTNFFSNFNKIRNDRAEQVIKDINAGNYWAAGINTLRTAGNMLLQVPVTVFGGGSDLLTGLLNLGDYSPEQIEKGSIITKAIPGYKEELYNSVRNGRSWEEFKETSVGKKLKDESLIGSDFFGILDSAQKQYEALQKAVASGQFDLTSAWIKPHGYMTVPEKIDDKPNGDYHNYNNLVTTMLHHGAIKPEGYPDFYQAIAAKHGLTNPKEIESFVKTIKLESGTDYALDLTSPDKGLLHINYTYDDGKERKSGTFESNAEHIKTSEFDRIFQNEQYAMANSGNHPYRDYWSTNSIIIKPDQKLDLDNILSLPKGNDEISQNKRYEGVNLLGTITNNLGQMISLSDYKANIYQLANGNYKIRYYNGESMQDIPEEFKSPEKAYSTLVDVFTK